MSYHDVHRPAHYNIPGQRETIDEIRDALSTDEFRGFCIGNSIKYVDRAGKKVKPTPSFRSIWRDLREVFCGLPLWHRENMRRSAARVEDAGKAKWYRDMGAGNDPRRDRMFPTDAFRRQDK